MDIKLIFHVFSEELLHATMWAETAKGLKGMMLRKKFVLPIESWILTFFTFFLLMVLHDVTFNVTATI
jgi:hypothetical protein